MTPKSTKINLENIIKLLNNFIRISDQDSSFFLSKLVEEKIKANTILIMENQKTRKLYFIKNGLLRTYFLSDGKDISTYFACDNQLITSYASFLTQKPSFEYLETIEDSILYSITYENLLEVYRLNTKFEGFGKILAEQNYLCLIERTYYLQAMQAKEKYLYFIEKYDKRIMLNVPQKHIASYLGITPETLSRVRKEISIS